MTDVPEPTDDHLAQLTRLGSAQAFGVLFARHGAVARRVARRMVPAHDVDDVVAEAFASTLAQLRRGAGPTASVRAYVVTAVRHEAYRRTALRRHDVLVDDVEAWSAAAPAASETVEHADLGAAYRALPERWRYVLWHLEVEGIKPHELATRLGLSANAVSALGCRARAGLRAALATEIDAA